MQFSPHALEGAIIDSTTRIDDNPPPPPLANNEPETTIDQLLKIARGLASASGWGKVIEYLSRQDDSIQSHPEVQELIGFANIHFNRLIEALSIFSHLKSISGESSRIRYSLILADLNLRLENVPIARELIFEFLAPWRRSDRFLRDVCRLLMKHPNSGASILYEIIRNSSKFALGDRQQTIVIDGLLRLLSRQGRSLEAIDVIQTLVDRQIIHSSQLTSRYAKVLLEAGRTEEAIERLETEFHRSRNPGIAVTLARALCLNGLAAEAINVLEEARRQHVRDPGVRMVLGELFVELNRPDEAESVFEEARRLSSPANTLPNDSSGR